MTFRAHFSKYGAVVKVTDHHTREAAEAEIRQLRGMYHKVWIEGDENAPSHWYEKSTPGRRIYCENRGPTIPVKRTVEVKCCGSWIHCDAFTVTCDSCGADYNFSGDRLAPRSQWGEETGEHWSDCY